MTITKLRCGGYAISYPGDACPVWVSDEDRDAAFAEHRARTLIAPAGTSDHPSLGFPRDSRPGSDVPTPSPPASPDRSAA